MYICINWARCSLQCWEYRSHLFPRQKMEGKKRHIIPHVSNVNLSWEVVRSIIVSTWLFKVCSFADGWQGTSTACFYILQQLPLLIWPLYSNSVTSVICQHSKLITCDESRHPRCQVNASLWSPKYCVLFAVLSWNAVKWTRCNVYGTPSYLLHCCCNE